MSSIDKKYSDWWDHYVSGFYSYNADGVQDFRSGFLRMMHTVKRSLARG
jgi:hypothetical protein